MAEIVRKKDTEAADEERKKKEERLRKLQEKLAKMEQQEKEQETIKKVEQKVDQTQKPLQKTEQTQKKAEPNAVIQSKSGSAVQKSTIELEAEQLLKSAGISLDEDEASTSELDKQAALLDDVIDKRLKLNIDIPEIDDIDLDKEFGQGTSTEEKLAEDVFQALIKKHDWLVQEKYGFMYTLPNRKNKNDFESWLNDWMHVFVDYAIISKNHYLYPRNLSTTKPFDKFTGRLTEILEICEGLVKKGTAEWVDKKKKDKLRVHWKTLANWADDIVNWARDNALSEPIFIQDIRDSMEDFANLPEEDLLQIFKIIEKNKDGKTMKVQNAIAMKFKL